MCDNRRERDIVFDLVIFFFQLEVRNNATDISDSFLCFYYFRFAHIVANLVNLSSLIRLNECYRKRYSTRENDYDRLQGLHWNWNCLSLARCLGFSLRLTFNCLLSMSDQDSYTFHFYVSHATVLMINYSPSWAHYQDHTAHNTSSNSPAKQYLADKECRLPCVPARDRHATRADDAEWSTLYHFR